MPRWPHWKYRPHSVRGRDQLIFNQELWMQLTVAPCRKFQQLWINCYTTRSPPYSCEQTGNMRTYLSELADRPSISVSPFPVLRGRQPWAQRKRLWRHSKIVRHHGTKYFFPQDAGAKGRHAGLQTKQWTLCADSIVHASGAVVWQNGLDAHLLCSWGVDCEVQPAFQTSTCKSIHALWITEWELKLTAAVVGSTAYTALVTDSYRHKSHSPQCLPTADPVYKECKNN